MKCYDCNIEVEPHSYPEGKCPSCGLTYILGDDKFPTCGTCGETVSGTIEDNMCLDCYLEA